MLREYNETKEEIEEIKKSWQFSGANYINMVDISRETYEKSGIEATVDTDEILSLN